MRRSLLFTNFTDKLTAYITIKQHQPNQRYGVSFIIAVLITTGILSIPLKLNFDIVSENESVQLELFKSSNPIENKTPVQPVEVKQPEPNDVLKPPPPVEKQKILPVKKIPEITEPVKIQTDSVNEPETVLPSSGVILNSAYGTDKLQNLGEDFSARTDNPNDFKFRTIEQPEWNKVTKLIDEDVDKPRIEMDFYSNGIKGAGERFMDKITPTKRFTTRYGTKIDCALFLLMPVCSWK